MKHPNFKDLVQSLPELFSKTEETYYKIVRSPASFYVDAGADVFWQEYSDFIKAHQADVTEDSFSYLKKIRGHSIFYNVKKGFEEKIESLFAVILACNPSIPVLLKAVYLIIELGNIHQRNKYQQALPIANDDTLQAAKEIITRYVKHKKKTVENVYSAELGECVMNLLCYQADLDSLLRIHDEFIWSEFELIEMENGDGYVVVPDSTIPKHQHSYILNALKKEVKHLYHYSLSFTSLSNELHFKKNDPVWKTNEGFPGAFHSPGVQFTGNNPGVTSVEMPATFFEGFSENGLPEEKIVDLITAATSASFHYYLRRSLADAYKPNDTIDVKKLEVQLEDVFFTVYELMIAAGCISAYAENINYINQISRFDVEGLYSKFLNDPVIAAKQWNQQETMQQFTSFSITRFKELEEQEVTSPFVFLSAAKLLATLRKAEELRHKTEKQLTYLIELFCSLTNRLPWNPLYQTEEGYFIYIGKYIKNTLSRKLYDHFVSDELFNSNKANKAINKHTVAGYGKEREKEFTASLKDLFVRLTPYCEHSIDYQKSSYGGTPLLKQKGEIDLLVYFKEEHLLMPIQVKLSNTTPRKERKKFEWVTTHLEKASLQLEKDMTMLKTEEGLAWASEQLNIRIKANGLRIEPLIVTDNFFADHSMQPLKKNERKALCVSYFEFRQLICGETVNELQEKWALFTSKPGNQLLHYLNNNIFWQFLKPLAERYTQEINIESLRLPVKIKRVI